MGGGGGGGGGGGNQLISKSRNYVFWPCLNMCTFLPQILSSQRTALFFWCQRHKQIKTHIFLQEFSQIYGSVSILVVHFTTVGWSILPQSFGVMWTTQWVCILRNFKNATFYVDCFLYWVDLMLFPVQYFILLRDKQQLTVKRILLRPFILTLPQR